MDWNAITSFTTIGEGTGISIDGDATLSGTGRCSAPKVGDSIAIAFTDPAFPTLEAKVVSTTDEEEIVIALSVDQTKWLLTPAATNEFGSAKKAAGGASEWIVRGAA